MEEVKYFTPKEANRTLPLVQRIVRDIQAAGGQLRGLSEEVGRDVEEDPRGKKLIRELQELFEELEQIGCSYKDWSFTVGLVDFPAIIDGKEVLLCWRSDEPGVLYYHGLEAGYAGRKRIPGEYLET